MFISFREYSLMKEALNYQMDKIFWSNNLRQLWSFVFPGKAQKVHEWSVHSARVWRLSMGHQHVLQFTKADQLSSLLNVQPANYKGQSESLIYHHISRRQNDHSEPGCQVDYIRFPSHSQSCFLFLPLTSKYPFQRHSPINILYADFHPLSVSRRT